MLPTWLIKKIDKKKKDQFVQEQLQIEVPLLPLPQSNETLKKDDVERGVIEIDLL